LAIVGCKDVDPPATGSRGIASLSPAATDLLIGMGLADRLVAVSNYDPDDAAAARPRVGDYQNVDWEKLAELRPRVMIMQGLPERMPAGLSERATSLGIRLVVLQIDRLEDIPQQMTILGEVLAQPDAARNAIELFNAKLERARRQSRDRAPPRTLIVLNEQATFVAGPGTFLDDVLQVAGGANALDASSSGYPTIDRERLSALAPDVIVQILPGASEAVLAQARANWSELLMLPAVRDGRVYVITEPWAMLPGYRQAELAERLSGLLHPRP
jgi:iron complex transport system substrate-binding protein